MKPKSTLRTFLCIASSSLLPVSYAHAADGTWKGNTGNWTDTTNDSDPLIGVWSGGTPADGADSTANFTGVDIAADQTITLNGNRTLGNIIFTDDTTSSHNLTITGDTLTLQYNTTPGMPSINVTQAGRKLTIASVIAGNDGLQKTGTGTLTLKGTNTFSVGLTIKAGAVTSDNLGGGGNFLGSGTVTIGDSANTGASANLNFNGSNFTSTNAISVVGNGASSISVSGWNQILNGGITLGNNLSVITNNAFGSNLTFGGGVTGTGNLVIQSNAAMSGSNSSKILFQTGSLNMVGGITNSGTGSTGTVGNIDTTISAVIDTNVTSVTQNSANSRLNLTGANTFTSNILISAGTLQANRAGSGNAPVVSSLGNPQTAGRTATISSGAILRFGAADVMGDGGSTPKLTLIANGGTILNGGNFINSLGPVQLNGGTLNSSGTGTGFKLTGTVTVGGSAVSTISSGGNIASNSLITYDVADAVAGSGSDLNVTAVLADVFGAGGVIKAGVGTMTLSNVNTYSGGTRIDNGTLALGANNTLPAFTVSIGAGTLNAATFDDTTIGTLDVSAANSTINLGSGANLAFAASNAVDWTGGTLNLTGTLDFSGTANSSLRFGITNVGLTAGLTPGQLLQIASPGWTNFALNASGYLTATSSGGNPYNTWATGSEPFDGDANGDGVVDGLAWFLGASGPGVNALNKLPVVAKDGAFLTLNFQRVNPYSPAQLYVQFGNDLSGWTEAEVPAATGTITLPGDDVEVVVTSPGAPTPDTVTVKIPTSYQSASGALFARFRAVKN